MKIKALQSISWRKLGYAFCAVLFLYAVLVSGQRQMKKDCKVMDVEIVNSIENHFIDREDVEKAVARGHNDLVFNRLYDSINLRKVETRIEKLEYVKNAEVSRDLRGNLKVSVELYKPIARIIKDGLNDLYLCEDGHIVPLSDQFTARVLTIDGSGTEALIHKKPEEDSARKVLMEFLGFVSRDAMWQKMITHVTINQDWSLMLSPQIGEQQIDFGDPSAFENKFALLETFYQKIIPSKGWSAYKKVTLKYNGQIICEKTS